MFYLRTQRFYSIDLCFFYFSGSVYPLTYVSSYGVTTIEYTLSLLCVTTNSPLMYVLSSLSLSQVIQLVVSCDTIVSLSSGHKNMLKTTLSIQLDIPQVGYWFTPEDILGHPKTTKEDNKIKPKTSEDS